MGDPNQFSDPQRDPVTDDLPATASEQELDDLLAHASELAGDLAESVGEPDRSRSEKDSVKLSESYDDAEDGSTLDEELARLEGLTSQVANEMGDAEPGQATQSSQAVDRSEDQASTSAAPAKNSKKEPDRTAGSSSAVQKDEVPDFMRDMMAGDDGDSESRRDSHKLGSNKPIPTSSTANASAPHATASATTSKLHMKPKPGVVGTGMLGVIGSPPTDPAQSDNLPDDGATAPSSLSANEAARESPVVRIARLAEPTALNACQSIVQLLERVDRPLGFIGGRLRMFLGWVALATLATAIIVYLISLF